MERRADHLPGDRETGYHPWLAYVMGERLGDRYRTCVLDSLLGCEIARTR